MIRFTAPVSGASSLLITEEFLEFLVGLLIVVLLVRWVVLSGRLRRIERQLTVASKFSERYSTESINESIVSLTNRVRALESSRVTVAVSEPEAAAQPSERPASGEGVARFLAKVGLGRTPAPPPPTRPVVMEPVVAPPSMLPVVPEPEPAPPPQAIPPRTLYPRVTQSEPKPLREPAFEAADILSEPQENWGARFRRSFRGQEWETVVGTNWLNKLGVTILVIGIALFLAYQLPELGPAGKVAAGYAVSAFMLGLGVIFERREQLRMLARAGIAGGWAIVYFTTYAMYHVPAAHVVSSEPVDLALLLVVAAAMVTHTLRYRSQVVTGLTFLLAFATVNISRGSAYSLIASAILAVGLAAISRRRHWFEMEIVGMAAVYLNHYLWLRPIIEPMHGDIHTFPGYAASAALLTGYWLIFRASYVLRSVAGRREELVSTLAAVLNAVLFVGVMGYQSVHPERAFEFFLAVGTVELVLGQLPVTRRRRTAFVVLTTLGSCLLVAAFPARYSGAALSVSWLAEAEALLLVGVLLREIVFRRLGMLAVLLVWIQMLGDEAATVLGERIYGVRLTGQPGLGIFFGIAAVALYLNAYWIPRRWPDVVQDNPDRLCFQWLPHMAGMLLFIGAWIACPSAWTAVAWSSLGLALTFAGRRWQLTEISLDGVIGAAAAATRVLIVNLAAGDAYSGVAWLTERLLTISLVSVQFYLLSRWAGVPRMISAERIAPAYSWVASAFVALLAWYELRPVGVALGWTLLGLVLLQIGLQRRSQHLRLQAHVAFAASFLRLFFVNLGAEGAVSGISPRVYTTAPLALAFYYAYSRLARKSADSCAVERRIKAAECHSFLGTLTLVALMRFELGPDWVVVAWAAMALLLVVIAWKTDRRIFLDQGMALGFGVLFRAIVHNLYERSYFPASFGHGRILSVGGAVALLFLVLPFAFQLRQPLENTSARTRLGRILIVLDRRPEQVFFFIPFVLLTTLLAFEVRIGMITLAWGIEGVLVFLLALLVEQRSYRLSGLGLLLLCVAKIIFLDVWGLAPRDRYLTFIVLGAALLAVSYLYARYRTILRQYL